MSDGIRVLLIEDDPMVQEVNRQFINRVDDFHVIDTAPNGKEGFEKVLHVNPDLVLLDVYMPSQDGVELLHQLRKNNIQVDVIAVTAARDKKTIQTILQYGARDYIIKPFKFDRMKQALEKYKRYREELKDKETFSQQQLDQLLNGIQAEASTKSTTIELPKGLNPSTLQDIISFLKQQQTPLSAGEIAESIGVARVTARRYLEFLKETEQIELSMSYGTVGRPVNRYVHK
ncbi:response regulator [Radiobacillus kanasensis]|uniref:response regulator n=1 Tax=Radiobacillus kanasensis TaxID=2844358 RepID=UPI001E38713F|nr:response regulator [Radiobacillus kanasensis]UFT98741.1 response regulator [Radiobacillus kanasensis]